VAVVLAALAMALTGAAQAWHTPLRSLRSWHLFPTAFITGPQRHERAGGGNAAAVSRVDMPRDLLSRAPVILVRKSLLIILGSLVAEPRTVIALCCGALVSGMMRQLTVHRYAFRMSTSSER
jgi:hypothetical protein